MFDLSVENVMFVLQLVERAIKFKKIIWVLENNKKKFLQKKKVYLRKKNVTFVSQLSQCFILWVENVTFVSQLVQRAITPPTYSKLEELNTFGASVNSPSNYSSMAATPSSHTSIPNAQAVSSNSYNQLNNDE